MLHEEYSLLESVIHITEERDKKSLANTLVETLSDFIDSDAIVLLRIPRNFDNEYLDVSASIPETAYQDKLKLIPHEYGEQRVALDDSLTLCIDKSEDISEIQNATQRTLFPIIVNDEITEILDIYGHHSTIHSKKLIQGFVSIYSNFLGVLDDNEHDALTGLLNRKTFDTQLSNLISESTPENNISSSADEVRRTPKKNTHRWVGILDIDHFKKINDNFGHIYGDEVLLLFVNLMEKTFRDSDLLFRYGGEEFVVVLEPTTESDAFMVFERFRKKLELYDFPQVEQVTVSTGIIKIDAQKHPSLVLEHADQALYYAKEHGRNQVCNYTELISAGTLKERRVEDDIELF